MATKVREHVVEVPELPLPLSEVQQYGSIAGGRAARHLLIFAAFLPMLLAPVFLTVALVLQGDPLAQRLLLQFNLAEAKVGFFGDSTVRAFSSCERDTDGIDDKLAAITGWPVTSLVSAGHTPRQWSVLAGLFAQTRNKPRIVIFPINLRSYSTGWGANPAWQFSAQKQYVRILSGDFTAIPQFVMDSVFTTSKAETAVMMNTEISAMGRHFGNMAELAQRAKGVPLDLECQDNQSPYQDALKAKFILNYMHDIATDHPLLQSLKALADALMKQDIRIAAYLVPVNVADGNALVGPEFARTIRRNKMIVTAVLEREQLPYVDLTEALSGKDFADKGCACEHLAAAGRQVVARRIAKMLQSLAPNIQDGAK